MLHASFVKRAFFKSHRDKSVLHPGRRWVYHQLFAGAIVAVSGGTYLSYRRAGWGDSHDGHLCGPGATQLLELLPLGYLSALWGSATATPVLPEWVHHRLIEAYVWWYGVDMHEVSGSVDSFSSLHAFFVRTLKAGARPIDTAAVLVSPVDGVVVATGDAIVGPASSKIVQVKGASYTLQNLLRMPLADPPVGYQRKYASFLLRAQDYHHVHAPCDLRILETVYVPGYLFPMTWCGYRWIANLFATNERVCLRCAVKDGGSGGPMTATTSKPLPAAVGNLWAVLVGGMLRGKIDLRLDARVQTNLAAPPEYAMRWPYGDGSDKVLLRGDNMARFRWGSAVVLVVDVKEGCDWTVATGDVVRVGMPIMQ